MRRSAEETAALVSAYLDAIVEHLEAIGCSPADVASYLRCRQQTLASLYLLIAQPNPSPTETRKLALRLALDARKPIEGNLERFTG